MRRICTGLLIILASSSTAFACLNGWDGPSAEQEFRSQYETKPAPNAEPGYRPSSGLQIGLGAFGIFGAGAFALSTGRTRA